MDFNPNYAIGEFAQDARREGRRRTWVLRAPSNKADWAESPIPKGCEREQKQHEKCFTKMVNVQQLAMMRQLLDIKRKFIFCSLSQCIIWV